MFCWRLWTEGLKEQLCGESQHPALYCTSPVIIEVIIEVVSWPLEPAVLSGSHSAQCVVLLSFTGRKRILFLFNLPSQNHQQCMVIVVLLLCSTCSQTMISIRASQSSILVKSSRFLKISWQLLSNLATYSWAWEPDKSARSCLFALAVDSGPTPVQTDFQPTWPGKANHNLSDEFWDSDDDWDNLQSLYAWGDHFWLTHPDPGVTTASIAYTPFPLDKKPANTS